MSGEWRREKRKQVVKQTDVIVDRSNGKMSHCLISNERLTCCMQAQVRSFLSLSGNFQGQTWSGTHSTVWLWLFQSIFTCMKSSHSLSLVDKVQSHMLTWLCYFQLESVVHIRPCNRRVAVHCDLQLPRCSSRRPCPLACHPSGDFWELKWWAYCVKRLIELIERARDWDCSWWLASSSICTKLTLQCTVLISQTTALCEMRWLIAHTEKSEWLSSSQKYLHFSTWTSPSSDQMTSVNTMEHNENLMMMIFFTRLSSPMNSIDPVFINVNSPLNILTRSTLEN